MFILFAWAELTFIASTCSWLNFPIFITKASDIETTSATSSISSDIIGEAPIANTAFAQSFTVTKLVMQWVNGFCF